MTTANRYFEVVTNRKSWANVDYTLICKNEKIALKLAIKESKFNFNDCVQIMEVDENGDLIDGYVSDIIFIKK
jgi:hypothetical protein